MAEMFSRRPSVPERRSDAPVQTDPIRDRLGRPAVARDVRCPNCGVTHTTSRRWQMRCPECNHIWIDRSSRTVIDKLLDARTQVFGTVLVVGAFVIVIGGFLMGVASLFNEVAGQRGWDLTYGLAAFFVACLVALVAVGLRRS